MSNKITAEGVLAVIGAGKEDDQCLKFTYGSESKLESGFVSEVTLSGGSFTVGETSFHEPKPGPSS